MNCNIVPTKRTSRFWVSLHSCLILILTACENKRESETKVQVRPNNKAISISKHITSPTFFDSLDVIGYSESEGGVPLFEWTDSVIQRTETNKEKTLIFARYIRMIHPQSIQFEGDEGETQGEESFTFSGTWKLSLLNENQIKWVNLDSVILGNWDGLEFHLDKKSFTQSCSFEGLDSCMAIQLDSSKTQYNKMEIHPRYGVLFNTYLDSTEGETIIRARYAKMINQANLDFKMVGE